MSSNRRTYQLKARAERQRQTRDRIIAATEALHREIGPARTTIADVARRAGVQRLTVYNAFATPDQLFAACQQRFLAASPPPVLRMPNGHEDAAASLKASLRRLYAWYRANEGMERNIHRDRGLLPELDALLRKTADARLDAAADAYASAMSRSGRAQTKSRALIRLALDFRTWDMLAAQQLSDAVIAELFTRAVPSQ
jgi:AcrR family transcriptional regulator